MLRSKLHSILFTHHRIILLWLLQFVVLRIQQVATDTEATETAADNQSDRFAITVDTMFWIGNTEFGERDNWRRRVKPCTLLERIRINEQSVISMGDSMDALGGALESNIKDLVMPMNGMLLLEESSTSDSVDPLFIEYLNQSGDCFDSSQYSDATDPGFLFEFELDSDQYSWFNPDNWRSAQMELEDGAHLIPESHMIPCNDDVVVFGSRRMALKTTIEDNERAETLTFKVNFRPSLALIEELNYTTANKDLEVGQLRVSKFKIGNQSYNQQELEQLTHSDQYENILFQFNDSWSLLKVDDGFAYSVHSLLTIDESSIRTESDSEYCLDEAGCICGNENTNIMKAICSFRHPIDPDELPCYDPISSSGYCDKICATVLTINMDPTRFKESFIFHLMSELIRGAQILPDNLSESSNMNLRRVSENKYEITLRIAFEENDSDTDYQRGSNLEREFAELFLSKLDDAKRSFYGIKSINLKASNQWRTSNKKSIFVISFIVIFIGLMANFAYDEVVSDKDRLVSATNIVIDRNENSIWSATGEWLGDIRRLLLQATASQEAVTIDQDTEPAIPEAPTESTLDGSLSEIPLLDL